MPTRRHEHALWRKLYQRQARLLPGRPATCIIDSLAKLGAEDGIPRFDQVSEKLHAATGWRLVAVPGLVPDKTVLRAPGGRRFPVTVWLRKPEEFDYIVEPDVFHDFFGHVPLLFNRCSPTICRNTARAA
jgi:phenylalanine-4-hydroxylase